MLERYWLRAAVLSVIIGSLASCAGSERLGSTAFPCGSVGGSLPAGADLPALPDPRRPSVATPFQQNGSDYISSFGAVGSLNAVSLQPLAGGIAWAMYSWDCGSSPVLSLSANHTADPQSELWLAVSDYAAVRWALYGPYASDAEVDLSSGSFLSQTNALYCCLIAYAPAGSAPGASLVNSVTLTLDAASGSTYTISGTIVDGAGQPVAGQQVELSSVGGALDVAVTNGSGVYSFAGLSSDTYTVTPLVDAATDADPENSTLVNLSGADVSGIDFEISPYESLGGTILDGSAQPVAGVEVSLVGGNGGSVMTSVAGEFLFPAGPLFDLSEGDSYDITPALSGYTFAPVSIAGNLPAGGIGNADFTAGSGPPSYTVSGRITDSLGDPVEGVSVSLTGQGSELTDSNGDYAFVGIPDGDYTLTPAVATTPPDLDITVAGADYPGCDFVTAGGGGGYTVSGTVTQSGSGNPVPNVDLKMSPGNRHATTDSNGYYEFTNTADGDYNIEPQMILANPPNRDITVAGADVAGVDFVNIGPPPPG